MNELRLVFNKADESAYVVGLENNWGGSAGGPKAINLLSWCRAPTMAKNIITHTTGETYVRILNPISH